MANRRAGSHRRFQVQPIDDRAAYRLFAHAATTLSIANCPLDGDGRIASSHGLRRTKEPIVLWALTFSVSYHML
ncbi:hypothetical protein Y032_0034g2887 [Ancylostoma ceylanicum]|nr:hypothetical protein Y032_0034g2887 [Ancylostoma ceylanicum]